MSRDEPNGARNEVAAIDMADQNWTKIATIPTDPGNRDRETAGEALGVQANFFGNSRELQIMT
jgi:hypothetical protein